VGGQNRAVGIGDREAEFAGAILRASERGDEQEQECCVDQDGVARNTTQMNSPRPAGDAWGIFYSGRRRRLWDGSATTFGRERAAALDEQATYREGVIVTSVDTSLPVESRASPPG